MTEEQEFLDKCEEERQTAKNPCAWCDRENGVERDKPVSHGICDKHSNEVIQSMYEGLASEWGYMV